MKTLVLVSSLLTTLPAGAGLRCHSGDQSLNVDGHRIVHTMNGQSEVFYAAKQTIEYGASVTRHTYEFPAQHADLSLVVSKLERMIFPRQCNSVACPPHTHTITFHAKLVRDGVAAVYQCNASGVL